MLKPFKVIGEYKLSIKLINIRNSTNKIKSGKSSLLKQIILKVEQFN